MKDESRNLNDEILGLTQNDGYFPSGTRFAGEDSGNGTFTHVA